MLYDWKNNKEDALKNGITEEIILDCYSKIVMNAADGVVAHHTFRNFDRLIFEQGTLLEDCIFEDCTELQLDECQIHNCVFQRVDTIFAIDSIFVNSKFTELACEDDMVLIDLTDSKISHCSFDDIELGEESCLCSGTADSWIEYCRFTNIHTYEEEQDIFQCEKTVGKIFKRKKQLNMVDEDTCIGLFEW